MSAIVLAIISAGVSARVRRSRCLVIRGALAMITIVAITGTLSACGRYGSPVRVAPTEANAELEVGTKDLAADESSDRKAENDRTE